MKRYTEICIDCLQNREATQIDGLPIPNTTPLFTKGLPIPEPIAGWVRCNIFREHTFVNKQNYVEGRISLNGKKVVPRI